MSAARKYIEEPPSETQVIRAIFHEQKILSDLQKYYANGNIGNIKGVSDSNNPYEVFNFNDVPKDVIHKITKSMINILQEEIKTNKELLKTLL